MGTSRHWRIILLFESLCSQSNYCLGSSILESWDLRRDFLIRDLSFPVLSQSSPSQLPLVLRHNSDLLLRLHLRGKQWVSLVRKLAKLKTFSHQRQIMSSVIVFIFTACPIIKICWMLLKNIKLLYYKITNSVSIHPEYQKLLTAAVQVGIADWIFHFSTRKSLLPASLFSSHYFMTHRKCILWQNNNSLCF